MKRIGTQYSSGRKNLTLAEWEATGLPIPKRFINVLLMISLASMMLSLATGCRTIRDRNANAHLQQARQLSLKGTDAIERQRYTDAEMLFAEALKQSEQDERAHWGYANALWKRGEKQKAVEHMEQALKLSERSAGGNPEYAIRLGEMYLEMGGYERARQLAESVLATKRNHAAAWALVGDTHKAEKRWSIAQECYQRALLIQPDYPRVQLSLAEIYRYMGKPQRSLAVVDRMIDLRDTARHDPQALLNQGLALADLNRHVEAKEILAKASERLPLEELDAHLQIAHAQHKMGELVAARMTVGRVREAHASNTEVHRLQSMLDMSFAHLSDPLQPTTDGHWNADSSMLAAQSLQVPTLQNPLSQTQRPFDLPQSSMADNFAVRPNSPTPENRFNQFQQGLVPPSNVVPPSNDPSQEAYEPPPMMANPGPTHPQQPILR